MTTLVFVPGDPCSSVLDPGCVQTVDNDDHPWGPPMPDIPAEIGSNALDDAAKAFQSAVGWLISHTADWWVKTPSPNLEAEPAIGYLHLLIRPVTIAVAVLALLLVAAKMALTRKADPAVDAGRGLVVLATVTVIGTVLPDLLLQWGDQWCGWVLDASSQGDFAKKMAAIVTLPTGIPAALVLLLSLVALFIGIVQALLLFRGAALIILAGLLPLAAAGMITTATRSWFTRVGGWMLALIFYKPAAAAVYATAFTLVGSGKSLHAVLMGFAMMLISLIAFPVLLKFFTWTTGGTDAGSGGGILGALMGSATAIGALRGYGPAGGSTGTGRGAAGEHADYLNQQLGDQGSTPSGAEPPAQPSPDPQPTPSDGSSHSGSPDSPTPDPGAPSGSTQPGSEGAGTSGQTASGANGAGWASPDGGTGEPVGPATVQAAERERRRGEDALRWMGNPTGSTDAGGPSGAAGGGGGAGGA